MNEDNNKYSFNHKITLKSEYSWFMNQWCPVKYFLTDNNVSKYKLSEYSIVLFIDFALSTNSVLYIIAHHLERVQTILCYRTCINLSVFIF